MIREVTSPGLKRVVWAVDAFETNLSLYQDSVNLIHHWATQMQVEVQPVYILSMAHLDLSLEEPTPWVQHYKPAAETALANFLAKNGLASKVARPMILLQRSSSTLGAVQLLSRYASSVEADLIMINSHARTGFRRFVLGSFAETLILRSSIPVMILGPNALKQPSFERILFPTDFGPSSKYAYRNAVRLAKNFNATLVLFHALPHPTEPLLQSGFGLLGGNWIPLQSYLFAETDRQTRRAKAWVNWAEKQGVPAELVIQSQGHPVAEQIVAVAEDKKVGLVAMEAISGPIVSTFLGSITRTVVRSAHLPIWVFRHAQNIPYTVVPEKKQAA